MPHILTPEQEHGLDLVRSTRKSIAFIARAGTGKTFELQQAASLLRGGWATSFSSSTTADLTEAMPRKFEAVGLHARGFRVIRSSGKFTELDPQKNYKIVKDLANDHGVPWDLISPAVKLIGLAKNFGLVPAPSKRGLMLDLEENWISLADSFDIPDDRDIISLAQEGLRESNRLALEEGIIDFDDQLYISTLWPHMWPKFQNIIVDEAQDLSPLQPLIVKKCLFPGGRVIAAGDDRQAIYAFRGALANSYPEVISKFNMTTAPLTTCWRCDREIIGEAQRYVPDIQHAPHAARGEVRHLASLPIRHVPGTVLCRYNAPLLELAMRLIADGRSAEVLGRDIGTGLISLTKRITRKNLKTAEFLDRLTTWELREINKKPKNRTTIEDKANALRAIASHHRDLASIQRHLDKLYPNPKARNYYPADVQLSTVHKFKGREADHVLFLGHPRPKGETGIEIENDLAADQEDNISYVGVPRARHKLHFISSRKIQ